MVTDNIKKLFTVRTLIGGLILVILIGGAYFLGSRQNSSQNTGKGITTVADKYKEQLPKLESAVNKNSSDLKARRDYAIALYAAGELEKAKEQYQAEIKLSNNNSAAYNNLGNVYRDQGKFEDAIKAYEQAIKLDGKNISAYLNLGHIYSNNLNKPDEAIRVYTDALEKNPKNTNILTQLALIYERDGDVSKAIEVYKDVLKQDAANMTARESIQRLEKLI